MQPNKNRSQVNGTGRIHGIRKILGDDVVFIPCREKVPTISGWQKKTLAEMDPVYLGILDKSKSNIGVLTGPNSNHLCAIDIDRDDKVEPFFKANPRLRRSARVRGAKGCKVFVRIEGPYPAKTKIRHGKEIIGDWLAGGAQAVVFGKHPDGPKYEWECSKPPTRLRFEELVLGEKESAPITTYSSESLNPESTESTESESTELLNTLNNILLQDERKAQLKSTSPFFRAYELFVEDHYLPRQGTRNATMVTAVTFLHRAFGMPQVIQLMTWFYELNSDIFSDPLNQHLSEVGAHLANCEKTFLSELSRVEGLIYSRLTDDQKTAFRICRDFAFRSTQPRQFFLSCNELSRRIEKDAMAAWRILQRFQRLRVLELLTLGARKIGSGSRASEYRWAL
jgi:hypothetical protein